jgi:hypothetical protein
MNKKDKIEARKAIFEMHKVFIIWTFVYTNIIVEPKFKSIFTEKKNDMNDPFNHFFST